MERLRYNINEEGYVTEIGYCLNYKIEVTNEPFGLNDAQNWRKDFEVNEWIFEEIIMIESISKLQAVSRLIDIDKYNDLMTALDADVTGVDRILFDAAHQLDRDSAMIAKMAVALGFDEAGTDEFFIEASKIMV